MYLAVSGNIGSGKSTLTRRLAQHYALQPLYEPHAENPYLEDFYRDMQRYAFHSQVYFLSRRLEQHLQHVAGKTSLIQDRTLFEDAHIFARNLYQQGHMQERDWQTYWGLYQSILPTLRKPDLLIHIEASLETLQQRIQQRGRAFEKELPTLYLQGLNGLYSDWILGFKTCPVIKVNADKMDLMQDEKAFAWLCQQIDSYEA